ncbi:hypothetical protein [Paraburkholderia sp. DHOC27]|uniref:hypothetical protein n=1 Tax=Paraburkholderia sp. DHOC27 TaxID=2303330 RepID=UPI000E3BA688|nr:hypothetical protein [Paraburkholderia sp. DHOC27]RFU47650.1 hypothetical protein D0B32_08805 [Paraburkholderia sp. DHOC27]
MSIVHEARLANTAFIDTNLEDAMNQPARPVIHAGSTHTGVVLASQLVSHPVVMSEAERAHQEWLLDDSLMQTFPASDAISPGFFT